MLGGSPFEYLWMSVGPPRDERGVEKAGEMTTPGPLHLHVRDADGERSVTLEASPVTAGRDAACELRLEGNGISRRHGRLVQQDDGWYYADAYSQNGSLLNGVPLTASELYLLHEGDEIGLVAAILRIVAIGDPIPLALSAPAFVAMSDLTLVASSGTAGEGGAPDSIDTFVSVGRAIDNDIVLSDPYVSGHHLEAWLGEGGLHVQDLSSRNGTFVGEERFTHGVVSPDATLRLGVKAVIRAATLLQRLAAAPEPSIFVRRQPELDPLLVGEGLGRVVGHGRVILRDVDVSVRAGQLIAIAGASGAGKSTLMRILNGYSPPDTGRLYAAPNAGGASEIGYVPQDDIINRELRLRDALVLSANLRYPPGTPSKIVEGRADEVMTELGLSESASTIVGQLSGGQRKRASVALELMTKPRLLLLDEPTSGLDPASDRRLIRLLRALADSGFGIVLITHTTANIAACDTVAFLAPGGYLVFWGSPEAAKRHFGRDNLEEVYEDLETEGTPAAWRQRFIESDAYASLRAEKDSGLAGLAAAAETAAVPGPRARAGTVRWQLRGLTRRYSRTLVADRRNLALLLLQVPVILALARVIFAPDVLLRVSGNVSLSSAPSLSQVLNGNVPKFGNATPSLSLLFVLATTLVWLGTINAAREICKELPIWERERHVGLLAVPYVLSKILVLAGLCAVQTVLLVALVALFWDVPGGTVAVLGILLTGFLASLSGAAIGLSISALVSTSDRAVALVPIVMIPQILFGGAIIPLSTIGSAGQAISSIVGARWTFEALGRLTDRAAYLPSGTQFEGAMTGPALIPMAALMLLATVFSLLALLLVDTVRGDGHILARLRGAGPK